MPVLPIKDISPCEIVWDYGESTAQELGPFLGATVFKGETTVNRVYEERYGEAAVDAVMAGTVASLELTMTRSTYEQLAIVLNAGELVDPDILPLKNQLGCEMYANAKRVVIKPICDNAVSEDPTEWVQIHRAHPVPGWELTWDRSTQRVFPIKFEVFVSQESGEEGEFGTMGMEGPPL